MPDRRPPASAEAHEQHDPLLVSQLVAGDHLAPEQDRSARMWLASCRHCARLAADLRHVSAMIASEPVPRRRRDLRLDEATAERLHGGRLARLMRGWSRPSSAAWRPAAAGLLSLGLVFMVAGYAWPEDGTVRVATETELAPPPSALAPTAPPVGAPEAPAAGADVFAFEEESDMAGPTYPEGLAEHQAGTSAREPATPADERVRTGGDAAAGAAAASPLVLGEGADGAAKAMPTEPEEARANRAAADEDADAAEATFEDEASRASQATAGPLMAQEPEAVEESESAPRLQAALESAAATAGAGAARAAADDGLGAVDASAAEEALNAGDTPATGGTAGDGIDIEVWLLVVGAALAATGGAGLLIGSLARRTRDPALR